MTAEVLSSVSGLFLSLLFSYIPGLKTWYGEQKSEVKSLIMLAVLVIVSVGVFVLSCYGPFDWVACTQDGAWGLVVLFVAALVPNQSLYSITKHIRSGRA